MIILLKTLHEIQITLPADQINSTTLLQCWSLFSVLKHDWCL